MRMTLPVLFLCAAALVAQGPPPQPGAAPPLDAVKQALGLTDAQITQLQQLQRDRAQAVQPIFQQMQTRQTSLADALKATAPDPAAVGRLVVEMEGLRKQIRDSSEKYQKQAVATLTAAQQTKLKALEDAAKLRDAIGQATALNLLVPPEPGIARGFRGPGPGLLGAAVARGRMMGAWRGRGMPR